MLVDCEMTLFFVFNSIDSESRDISIRVGEKPLGGGVAAGYRGGGAWGNIDLDIGIQGRYVGECMVDTRPSRTTKPPPVEKGAARSPGSRQWQGSRSSHEQQDLDQAQKCNRSIRHDRFWRQPHPRIMSMPHSSIAAKSPRTVQHRTNDFPLVSFPGSSYSLCHHLSVHHLRYTARRCTYIYSCLFFTCSVLEYGKQQPVSPALPLGWFRHSPFFFLSCPWGRNLFYRSCAFATACKLIWII